MTPSTDRNPPPVYLDCAAATPVLEPVLKRYVQHCRHWFANPHAGNRYSENAYREILRAQTRLLEHLDIPPDEATVTWTGGGTEAVNLGIVGALRAEPHPEQRACLAEASAHPAVLEPARSVARAGGSFEPLPVDAEGALRLDPITAAGDKLKKNTLVALCHVNNETGACQDLAAVRRWMDTRLPSAQLTVDAMQSAGKYDLRWREARPDFIALGSRKFGGPPHMGALIARKNVRLQPLLFGGGQQDAKRPGTLDTAGILALVDALEWACKNRANEWQRMTELNRKLRDAFTNDAAGRAVVLSPENASPYILSVAFPGCEGAILMRALAERGVVVGTGSACSAETRKTSHVLAAMGINSRTARGVLRISMGHTTTRDDVDTLIAACNRVLETY